MPFELWSAIIQAGVALAIGLLAMVQLHVGRLEDRRHRVERDEMQRRREDEIKAADAKRRDVEMFHWGTKALDVFTEVEAICAPLVEPAPDRRASAERLATQASSLVDQGRLFFRNVYTSHVDGGYRPLILDQILRCCYAAQYIAEFGAMEEEGPRLRAQIYAARRTFVRALQSEMKNSLRDEDKVEPGQSVDPDPRSWPEAETLPRLIRGSRALP